VSSPATCWEDAYRVQTETIKELRAENAQLRKDSTRLDWLARNRSVSSSERPLGVTPESLRAAIDAARKEAQP
jgi:hypothetical protein